MTRSYSLIRLRLILVCVVLMTGPAAAQESAGGQSLDQAANDPTASLMSAQIQNIYTGAYHNLDDESAKPCCCGRRCRSNSRA